MARYLYGAAVQGIQSFIFQTNKLKEIIGASELVESVCTSEFAAQIGKTCLKELEDDPNAVINAAGNIKYVFESEELLEKTFLEFPMRVQKLAPGITISHAVVRIEENMDFGQAVSVLEEKLKTQRNRVPRARTLGLIGVRRSRTTGLPVVKLEKEEYLDDASVRKRGAASSSSDRLVEKMLGESKDRKSLISDIAEIPDFNDWIAVVHIDGNNMGQIVRTIGKDRNDFHNFSLLLDKATAESAEQALNELKNISDMTILPLRPIVLGGDDLTVVIRGDLAIDFTGNFLKAFECNTKKIYDKVKCDALKDGMTACAGIAFIKSSYPFYYGYHLAEALCDAAKKDAKSEVITAQSGTVPSCMMFHKVQDSFVESYSSIVKRELTPQEGISLDLGPYYLYPTKERWTINDLTKNLEKISTEEGNAIKSHLRRWLTVLHQEDGIEKGKQLLDRLKTVTGDKDFVKILKGMSVKTADGKTIDKYPIYDLMSLFSVTYHKTR